MQDWADNYSTYSCTLYDNITLSDEWTPIGTDSAPYTATFDGGGHIISNLKIESSSGGIGFFGYIGSGGKVANLTLESPNVSASSGAYVGIIAGYNNGGSIELCTVLVGTVSGVVYVGGIAGYASSGTVSDCTNSGDVSGGGEYVGAVVGRSSGTVSGCKWLSGTAESGIGEGTDEGTEEYYS